MLSTIVLAASLALSAPAPGCMTVVRPVAAGQPLVAADVADNGPCERGADKTALRYASTSGLAFARRDLAKGDVLPRIGRFALPEIRPGQSLILRTQVGPVEIERVVVALQAGHVAGKLFVRAADGDVFPVAVKDIVQ